MSPSSSTDVDDDQVDLRDHLQVLQRHKLLILATVLVALAAAVASTLLTTPRYRATTEVLLQQDASEGILTGTARQNAADVQQLVQTEIQIMRSRSVEEAVAAKLGRTPDVAIAAKDETQVVAISASSSSPRGAVREADTYASVYVGIRQVETRKTLATSSKAIRDQLARLDDRAASLRTDLAELRTRAAAAPEGAERTALEAERDDLEATVNAQEASLSTRKVALTEQVDQLELAANLSAARGIRIVSKATVPADPFTPRPRRDVGLALVAGLLVGAALAFARDHLDDTIRSKEDLDRSTGGLSVLGLIPEVDRWRDRAEARLESVANPTSSAAEAYRGVRTSLQFIGLERKLQLIQVTSSVVSEGKSTTAANLAVALARAGKRVVLVDCDLRRPRVHSFFGMDNTVGFTSLILQEVPLADALQPVLDEPRLFVLPSGVIPPNPSELLSSSAAMAVLDALDATADFVIVDCPPLLPVADSVILAGYVDATILVATSRRTTKASIRRALELLGQADAPLVGVVFNKVKDQSSYGYGYGYSAARPARSGLLRRQHHDPVGAVGPHDRSGQTRPAGEKR